MAETPCRMWAIRRWRLVRCSRPAEHVRTTKWHIDERAGLIWAVKDKERERR